MNRKIFIFAIVALAAFGGCHKQLVTDVPAHSQGMVVGVKTETASMPKFTFLFWHKADFYRGLSSADIPYFVASTGQTGSYVDAMTVAEGTSEYRLYNTGKMYPDNYGIAVCTGYAPYNELTPADNACSSLSVAAPGTTDVLVARNYLEGSSVYPFEGTVEFVHPQIQLTVQARLAETMAKYIKGVSFSVGGENLLKGLQWDNASKMYQPSAWHDAVWTSKVEGRYLNKGEERELGTVLVIPEADAEDFLMTSIDLTISGLIANTNQEAGTPFTMNVTADLTGADGGGLALGDSYEVLLLFDEDQIEITAVKVPWEEGGNVLVPIHPIPQN